LKNSRERIGDLQMANVRNLVELKRGWGMVWGGSFWTRRAKRAERG